MNKKNNNHKNESPIDYNNLSLSKKLYILREAIDFLALGVPVNQELIDKCYDDLNEYIIYNESFYKENFDELENLIEDNINYSNSSLESLTKSIYGDSWTKLQEGLDQLNIKYGTFYQAYMYPNEDNTSVKIKIFDDQDTVSPKLKRWYDDKYDLELNLEQDLKTNFKASKIILSDKKLSKDKKENIE